MPVHGKHEKDDTTVFPTLSTGLGNRYGDFHISTAMTTYWEISLAAQSEKGERVGSTSQLVHNLPYFSFLLLLE
jgi:hypothetical protein